MSSQKSNIYLSLLEQEVEKVATNSEELTALKNKAQTLLALVMRSNMRLDDLQKATKDIIDER